MSNQASEAHIQTYTARVGHLLQQRGSKLMSGVSTESHTGKSAQVVQQYGAVEAMEITDRHADTELTSTPQTSRWVRPSDWGVADMVDKEDLIRSMTDPKSDFAMAQTMGLGRKQDDLIIDAIFGSNFTGEDGGTSVTATADGQTSVPSGGAGMTVAKLRTAKKNLMAAELDLDHEMLYMALTAEQIDDLYTETQIVSIDYNSNKVLVDGRVQSFMGWNFIHCERLTVDGASARRCPGWAKSGLVFATWNGIETSTDRRPDKWNNWQVMSKGTWGATRTEGAKTVEVLCTE